MTLGKLKLRKRFLASAIIITATIAFLLFWYAKEVKRTQEAKIASRLASSSDVVSYLISDNIKHTEFLMKVINSQIKRDPKNLEYIEGILSKYRVNDHIKNSMSWTMFTWADERNFQIVDAVLGIVADKPYDLNSRDYIHITKYYPDRVILGKPVFGTTSKKWMIPAGVGVQNDNDVYLGAITTGFDLNLLARVAKSSIKDENVQFYIFDIRGNLLIDSSRELQGPDNVAPKEIATTVNNYINSKSKEELGNIDIIGQEENFLLRKFEDQPLYIYVKYEPVVIRAEFWQDIVSRLVELTVLGIVGIMIALYIRQRERRLRRRAEDSYQLALSASRGKSEFLAYTGHELRSPLNVIIFGSEMMKSKMFGDMPPKYVEYAEDIYQNGNDLLHFIEDLMDVTKADEEGSFTLHPEYVDVSEIIDRVIKLNVTRATKHKVKLEKLVANDLPKLWADSRRLRQILNNLISNAVKYSPENTKVRIVVHSIDGIMQIVVEDEGFGMNNEQIHTALSRYGTVQNANTGKVESIGLGLPLVKQLVDAHKGKFDIVSEPAKGTTVTLTFKLTEQRL